MSRLIPGYLNSLRARLVLAFAAIVAFALILVLATLPTQSDPFAMASDFLTKGFFDRAFAEVKRALITRRF